MAFCSFRHFGRMGNFLYESAATYAYSKKHGLNFSMPNHTNDTFWNPLYLQHLVLPEFNHTHEEILVDEIWKHDEQYKEIPFEESWRNKNIFLNGYFQSYKYFDFCREEMLDAFAFPYNKKEDTISLHIRRGDYLLHPTKHPVITIEYIQTALLYLKSVTGIKNVLIHSDDIMWCKVSLQFLSKDFYISFSEGKNEIEDLISMANCEHQVCSNSTLATWGAELNRNPNKKVVVPSTDNWFGVDNHFSVKDMFRPEWIQIRY